MSSLISSIIISPACSSMSSITDMSSLPPLHRSKPYILKALVMDDGRMLTLPPIGTEIVKRCRSALCLALEGKFQCAARIQNVDDDAALSLSHSKAAIVPEIKYSKQLSKNLKVSVWKDDLTTHQVDAVVNAANEYLDHGAGLAGALSQAGGHWIQKWSNDLIKQRGIIPTGQVVTTAAGNLPCKTIIHAVGPCVTQSTILSKASELLQKTVENILIMTYKENLQSVAIPAISSGLFNFPLAKCAEIMVKTVKSFDEELSAGTRSLEVRLVNNDDPSVQEMRNACLQILGSNDALPVQNLGSAPTQSPFPSLDLGNVTLYLKKGAIENETTDVIVNTTGNDLVLSKGQVSKALMDKAGWQIQHELKQIKRVVHDSDVLVTSGSKLRCKAVYHTVCAQKKDYSDHAEQVLHSVVTSCLNMAYSKGYSSIAFPALGTGNLGFKGDVVSKIMTTAVEEFSSRYTGSKFDVFFVIFPRDTETLKAFESKMDSTNRRRQKFPGSTDRKSPGFYKRPESETPFIELHAPSPEALREAMLWIKRILCLCPEKLEIHNNNIVHLSLEDHEKLTSLQSAFRVEITELFKNGHGCIIIKGVSVGVGRAALEVEAMLCQAQENFARNEMKYMQNDLIDFGQQMEMTSNKLYQKTPLNERETQEWIKMFSKYGLSVLKVEKIENPALKQLFILHSKRIQAPPRKLFQRVSAQFIDLICNVGFQREYSPPRELKYGAGIYFTSDLEKAKYFWPEHEEEFIYFISAQVLTGKDATGSPEMIVPPPIGGDPLVRYDSVTNNRGVHIIFNGQQACPELVITCRKKGDGTLSV